MNYTDPKLRNALYIKILNSNTMGTKKGQWSARKAQLLAKEYKSLGGGYKGPSNKSQRSLVKWTNQKWTTKSGIPSHISGERYLPEKAIRSLTKKEYDETTKKKKLDTLKGLQFSKQPKNISLKVRKYRI
jgi:hypothetical protein